MGSTWALDKGSSGDLDQNVQIRSGELQKPGRQSQLHVLDLKCGDGFIWERET